MSEPPPGLIPWIAQQTDCAQGQITLSLVAGDASPRRYYRVSGCVSAERSMSWSGSGLGDSLIAMVSPPTENNEAFLHVGACLAQAGVHTPAIWAKSEDEGWFLLEDLGDQQLLMSLVALPPVASSVRSQESATKLYDMACDALLHQISLPIDQAGIPPYDRQRLQGELDVFVEWFLSALLGFDIDAHVRERFTALSDDLIASALAQPTVWVHRDFHSRNLMILGDGEMGVIDFQDAVLGPITYDPVSLFKDCYIRWPREQQLQWLDAYLENIKRAALVTPGLNPGASSVEVPSNGRVTLAPKYDEMESSSARPGELADEAQRYSALRAQHLQNLYRQLADVSPQQFQCWFDLMGLQRHLKVLGVFARLHLRDQKSGYLDDLPLVVEYVREALVLMENVHDSVGAFRLWFEGDVMPAIKKQPWYRPVDPEGWVL